MKIILSGVQWESAYSRGAALAEGMAPDVIKIVDEIIDQWLNEHTTLSGDEQKAWRTVICFGALEGLSREMRRNAGLEPERKQYEGV